MSLIDLIKTHCLSDAEAGSWSAVTSTLNAQTIPVRNPKSWTFADLIGLVGAEGAALVGGTIQAAGASNPIFASAWIALSVTGLQLHSDERQAMIDGLALAGSWPNDLKNAVKAAGVAYTSLAGSTVTAQQCETAWNTEVQRLAFESYQERFDSMLNMLRAGLKVEAAAALIVLADEWGA